MSPGRIRQPREAGAHDAAAAVEQLTRETNLPTLGGPRWRRHHKFSFEILGDPGIEPAGVFPLDIFDRDEPLPAVRWNAQDAH